MRVSPGPDQATAEAVGRALEAERWPGVCRCQFLPRAAAHAHHRCWGSPGWLIQGAIVTHEMRCACRGIYLLLLSLPLPSFPSPSPSHLPHLPSFIPSIPSYLPPLPLPPFTPAWFELDNNDIWFSLREPPSYHPTTTAGALL